MGKGDSNSKIGFVDCFRRAAKVFSEQTAADLESGDLFRHPDTLRRLREINARNSRENWLYGFLDRNWLVPFTGFLDFCQIGSEFIREHGLLRGCRKEIERQGFRVEHEMSDQARRLLLSDRPVLFVGNHPCTWGPDLWAVAAALDEICPERHDFLLLTWTLVTALCPGLGPYSAPVVVSARDIGHFTHDEESTPDDRPLGFESVFATFAPDIPMAESRERNRQALDDMVERWLAGGDIFIFPTGGAGTKAVWFSGLGRILRQAIKRFDENDGADPHMLFFRVEGASDLSLLGPPLLARWHPARVVQLFYRRRVRVRFDEVYRVRDHRHEFGELSDRQLARRLQEEYQGNHVG